MQDDQKYQLVTVKRRNEGIVSRGFYYGRDILVKNYYEVHSGDYLISKRQLVHGANGQVPESLDKSIVSNEYMICIGNENLTAEFLTLLSKTQKLKRDFFLSSYGVDIEKLVFDVNDWKKRSLIFPNKNEQKKISDFFIALDTLITLHQRKYDKLVAIKKSMLEKMFPREGSRFPEIRFAGFTDPWEQRKLGDLMNVTSVKRIHQSDWTDSGIRFLRARDIVAAAKGEEPSDLLYISKEKYEEYSALSGKVAVDDLLVTGVGTIGIPYLISNSEPLYFKDGNIIWFQNGGRISGRFFYYSFISDQIQSFIRDSAGIGTVGTYTIESGKRTPILLPNGEEQQQIGAFLSALDALITLHQRKLEKLQAIKRSMLEKMFV